LCAWVSSHDQKAGLDRQVARLSAWPTRPGLPVVRVEAGAGWLLADLAASMVVVEHRGRLGRMKAELAGVALTSYGRCLVVLDGSEVTGGLVRNMMGMLTSFCAPPGARNRALEAVGCAQSVTSARGPC
jgi:putative resolvase